ncbi:MAG: hypothetical protein H7X70_06515 [Candidatus Kapabacteria bacterium]|nr:hypothetical protein [Candidatus Kapabacteria bacterium]
MVVRYLLTIIISVSLLACSGNESPKESVKLSTAEATASDTASAKTISFTESKIDSFVLRYKKGDEFHYRVRQYLEAGPDTARATTQSTHVYTKKVLSVRSDGSFEVVMRFDTIRIDAFIRNKNTGVTLVEQHYFSSDSTQRTKDEFVQFNAIIGEDVSVFISPRGAILQVGDVSPIVKKMVSTSKQTIPPEYVNQLSEQVKASFYSSFHGQEVVPFPTNKIDQDGKWSNAVSTPFADFFILSTIANYHIVNVKEVKNRRLASINASFSGSCSVRPLPKNVPFSVKVNSSSISGTSHSLLDVEGGYTISKKTAITMHVAATVVSPKGEKNTVSQNQTSRYEIELLP